MEIVGIFYNLILKRIGSIHRESFVELEVRIMVINWSGRILAFLNEAAEHDEMIDSMKKDLEMIQSALFSGEKVILVFVSGSHFEIYPLFEKGEADIRGITRDFNEIYQYNSLKNKIAEIEEELKEALKNDPENLAKFEEFVEFRRNSPLYRIDLYKDHMLRKTYKRITYRDVETYIRGVLAGLGIRIESRYAGQVT